MDEVFNKIVSNVGMGIIVLPFIAVLCSPKDSSTRLCLLIFMTLELVIQYALFIMQIVHTLQQAEWWEEQAATSKGYNKMFLEERSANDKLNAYFKIAISLILLPFKLLILRVIFKFYKTGVDARNVKKAPIALSTTANDISAEISIIAN